PLVHLSHGLASLLRAREADETKSLALTKPLLGTIPFFLLSVLIFLRDFVTHNLGGSDSSIRSKLLAETLVINLVIEVLDVPIVIEELEPNQLTTELMESYRLTP